MSKDAPMIVPSAEQQIRQAAKHYFNKGRCSGHDQFNGRYCRDASGPDQWCVHCAGFMLLTLLDTLSQELERLKEENQELLTRSGKPDADRDFSIHAATDTKSEGR